MSIVTDYSNCERYKVENGRMYDFNCNTGEESDNCLVCGEQKCLILVRQNNIHQYEKVYKKGYGSIHLRYKNGICNTILLEKPLTEEEILDLKKTFNSEELDLNESSVMIWNEEKSELERFMGVDIRTVAPYDFA